MTEGVSRRAGGSARRGEVWAPQLFLEALAARAQAGWQSIVVFVPFVWLLVFFLAPFFIVLKISVAESLIASPPFSALFEFTEEGILTIRMIFENFAYLWEDDLYVKTYLNSIKISTISTLLCLLIGYPIAYAIVRAQPTARNILLLLIILPRH